MRKGKTTLKNDPESWMHSGGLPFAAYCTKLNQRHSPQTEKPHVRIAQTAPYPGEVTEGKTYFWCACGKSQRQPFCDGAHKGTGIEPVKYTAEASKKLFFCGCKKSATPPFCDGSHARL